MTLATQEVIVDAEIVATSASEWAEIIRADLGRAVEGIVSAGRNLIAAKADVSHGKWLTMLKEIGISQPYAFKLMRISERFPDHSSWNDLPSSIAALYELSRMDPSDVEDGIESGHISPDMTIKEAREFARSDWPEVPPPANVNPETGEILDDEELVRRFEETHERLVNEGVIPPPRTEEERRADAREFVQSLIGDAKRHSEPLTPEDKFAKALNAVGAAIRINHGVNEALLNEDGWSVLRALGLR